MPNDQKTNVTVWMEVAAKDEAEKIAEKSKRSLNYVLARIIEKILSTDELTRDAIFSDIGCEELI